MIRLLSQEAYINALDQISVMIIADPDLGTPEADMLNALTESVLAYERVNYNFYSDGNQDHQEGQIQ